MNDIEKRYDIAYSLYSKGEFEKSFKEYLKLAEEGYENCQTFIAWMYFSGEGTQKDLEESKRWYLKATSLDDGEGLFYLGKIFYIQENFEQAYSYFEKSAATKYPPALYRLGRFYQLGIYVEQDHERAYELFLDSSKEGHLFSKKELSKYHIKGFRGGLMRIYGALTYIYLFIEAIRLGLGKQDDKFIT